MRTNGSRKFFSSQATNCIVYEIARSVQIKKYITGNAKIRVYTKFRIYRKLNIRKTEYMHSDSNLRDFFTTLDKAFSECYTRCVALRNISV